MKIYLKVLGFILTFCFLFFGVSENLFKNYNPTTYYIYNTAPRNSIDLLFVGSSHSYYTFNTKIFDNILEVNSYNLGTDSQSMQSTYYVIKESLKKQAPKIIVIEAYSLYIPRAESDRAYANTRNAYDDMKLSLNKIEMARENFPKRDRILQFFNTTTYHEKWKDINKLLYNFKKMKSVLFNFEKEIPQYKGFSGYNFNYIRGSLNYSAYIQGYQEKYNVEFPPRNIELFEKTAKILKEKNIKLIVVSVPVVPRDEMLKSKYSIENNEEIKKIAKKYDVDIVNFNNGKTKLEKIHFLDDVHVSLAGSDIISENVAHYLKSKYLGLFKNSAKEIDNKSPEYYFYSKNESKNKSFFKKYEINIEIEKDLKINELIFHKKAKNTFDVYLKMETVNSPYFYVFRGESQTQINLFGTNLIFREKTVADKVVKYLLYPKYYIRKINGEYYIYVKDFKVEESKLPINK